MALSGATTPLRICRACAWSLGPSRSGCVSGLPKQTRDAAAASGPLFALTRIRGADQCRHPFADARTNHTGLSLGSIKASKFLIHELCFPTISSGFARCVGLSLSFELLQFQFHFLKSLSLSLMLWLWLWLWFMVCGVWFWFVVCGLVRGLWFVACGCGCCLSFVVVNCGLLFVACYLRLVVCGCGCVSVRA